MRTRVAAVTDETGGIGRERRLALADAHATDRTLAVSGGLTVT